MRSFWETVRDRLERGERVFLCLVIDHSVHSPGTTGARLALFADGSSLGTVGGGVMELDILANGRAAMAEDPKPASIRKLVHRADGEGEKSGLICAGFQTNLYHVLLPDRDLQTLDEIVSAARDDRPLTFAIDPKGLRVEEVNQAPPLVQHRLEQSETGWSYFENAMNLSRVAILGGGHCGLSLSRTMRALGYHVTIFDTRPRVPTMLVNESCDEKHFISDFASAGSMIRAKEHTDVVVMTTALASDVEALSGLIGLPFPFVGVMGSRAKISAIRKALRAQTGGDRFLTTLVAPVGLPIGSNTPDEIAISVAAQLLQRRSRAAGGGTS